MIRAVACGLSLSLWLPSCGQDDEARSGQSMERSDFEVGEYNQEGRLVFWEINAFDHMQPFVLYEDYGVMLWNEGGEENPSPLFILACQKTKEVFTYETFESFRQELLKIPSSAAIICYSTCTVPRTWGLPQQLVREYRRALAGLESTHRVEAWTVCYCPHGDQRN